jgi:hypothetical protein
VTQRRALLILITLLLVIVCALVTMTARLWSETQRPAHGAGPERGPSPTPWVGAAPAVALSDGEAMARESARAWAADAALLKAEAMWQPAGGWVEVDSPPVSWSYYYYSVGGRAITAVAVHGERAFVAPAVQVSHVPATLRVFPPPQGDAVAWLSFRGAGGDDFLAAHPGAIVQLTLRQAGQPVWLVAAYTPEDRLEVAVDATSGLVLSSERAPNP